MDDRYRFAPISLSGKHPIPEFIFNNFFPEIFKAGFCIISDYGQTIFLREKHIPLIVGGHTHDSASTVVSHDVLGFPDWNFFFRCWIGHILAGKFICLSRNHHESSAPDGVGPGGKYFNIIKSDEGPFGATNPVLLLHLHSLGIVDFIKSAQKLVGILGNGEHPLLLLLKFYQRAAALAFAVHYFFVRQANFILRAPVDVYLGFVSQAVFHEFQEKPLRPFVILRVSGIDLARPVERHTETLELFLEILAVFPGDVGGGTLGFDGVVLRRQSESVVAYREHDIVTFHPALARDDIHGRIATHMASMQSVSGGIRKFHQRIVLWLWAILRDIIRALLLPLLLPLGLDFFGVVLIHKAIMTNA